MQILATDRCNKLIWEGDCQQITPAASFFGATKRAVCVMMSLDFFHQQYVSLLALLATLENSFRHGLLDRPKNSLPRTWRFIRQKLQILWQHMQGPGGGRWVKDVVDGLVGWSLLEFVYI